MDSLAAYGDDESSSSGNEEVNAPVVSGGAGNVVVEKEAANVGGAGPVPPQLPPLRGRVAAEPAGPTAGKRKLIGSRLAKHGGGGDALPLPPSAPSSFVLPVDAAKVQAAMTAAQVEAATAAERTAAAAEASKGADGAAKKKRGGLFSYLPAPKHGNDGGASTEEPAASTDSGAVDADAAAAAAAAAEKAAREAAEARKAAELYGDNSKFGQAPAADDAATTARRGAVPVPGSSSGGSGTSQLGGGGGGNKRRKIRSLRDLPVAQSTAGAVPGTAVLPVSAGAVPAQASMVMYQQQFYQQQQQQEPPQHFVAHQNTGPTEPHVIDEDAALAGLNLPASFHRERDRLTRLAAHRAPVGRHTQKLLASNSVTAAMTQGAGGFMEVNMADMIHTTSEQAAAAPKSAAEMGFIKTSDQRKGARLTYLAKQAQAMAPELEDHHRRAAKNRANATSKYGW